MTSNDDQNQDDDSNAPAASPRGKTSFVARFIRITLLCFRVGLMLFAFLAASSVGGVLAYASQWLGDLHPMAPRIGTVLSGIIAGALASFPGCSIGAPTSQLMDGTSATEKHTLGLIAMFVVPLLDRSILLFAGLGGGAVGLFAGKMESAVDLSIVTGLVAALVGAAAGAILSMDGHPGDNSGDAGGIEL